MTVAELIALLATFPGDLPVHFYTNYDDISVSRARQETYGGRVYLFLEGDAVPPYLCPVCDAPMEDAPMDWNICTNCWCEFAGDGETDAKSGLPMEQYREKFRRGDFNERNAEYRQTLEESLRRRKP